MKRFLVLLVALYLVGCSMKSEESSFTLDGLDNYGSTASNVPGDSTNPNTLTILMPRQSSSLQEGRAFDLDPVIQKNREDYAGFVESLSSHTADTLDLYIETFTAAQNDSEDVKTLLEIFDPVNNPPK